MHVFNSQRAIGLQQITSVKRWGKIVKRGESS